MNSGRLLTYVLLGLAFGAFGRGMELIGLQRAVSIAAGCLLLAAVVVPNLLERWSATGRAFTLIAWLRGTLSRQLRRTAPEAIFFTGLFNGLLPCGLLYAALLGATVQASVATGAAFMALFGLGTWPAMIALRMSKGLLGPNVRAQLRRAAPVMMAIMGGLLILRGMQLGIPMVSPGAPTITAAGCH
jgi:sulfite exporter TauE/SafE